MMKLPSKDELVSHIRATLVVQAEVQFLALGGELGCQVATQILGIDCDGGTLPTDMFDDDNIADIQVDHLAVYRSAMGLRDYLERAAIGAGTETGDVDTDFIEQEYLNLLELYLSSLPSMTFGGYDWGSCKNGALRDLLLAGQAWHDLLQVIDESLNGDFDDESLSPSGLALLGNLELRTLRNQLGPNKKLRTRERVKERKSDVSERGFAGINRFDALDWLIRRKGFSFGIFERGMLAARLETLDDPNVRGRAAVIAGLIHGNSFEVMAKALEVPEQQLRNLADGEVHEALALRAAQFVMELDKG